MELPNSNIRNKINEHASLPQVQFKSQITFPEFKSPEIQEENFLTFQKDELIANDDNEIVFSHSLQKQAKLISREDLIGEGRMEIVPDILKSIDDQWFFYKFSDGCTVFSRTELLISKA